MRLHKTWLLMALACYWAVPASAHLQLVPDQVRQQVFAGDARNIVVIWRNDGNKPVAVEIGARIFQTSSATAIRLGDKAWKKLQVLPQQTVLESAELDFPAVKARTLFLIQWLDDTNHVLGITEVLVYPTNLLAELKPLAGEKPLGVVDPQNQLKPLLKGLQLNFADLEDLGLESFSGGLAIIGPFQSRAQMREGLAEQIQALAKKGVAIVWTYPPDDGGEKLRPSFYPVPEQGIAVMVVQPDLVADLRNRPQSQLNLVYFCRQALHPQPLTLPDLTSQP